jgi:hypothetical protein
VAQLDNAPLYNQMYTFGPSVPNLCLAGGNISGGKTIFKSTDGKTWSSIDASNIFLTSCNGLDWDGSRWVAVGTSTLSNNIVYSDNNGVTWTVQSGTKMFSTQGNGVAWNGSRWVAVGQGTNTIAYSGDGINWTGLSNTYMTTAGNAVAWNGSRWIAVGTTTGNTIVYSDTSGATWQNPTNKLLTTSGNGVAWNGSRWIAVGQSTGNTIVYSDDNGLTWTGQTLPKMFSTSGNGVAWNGTRWVAVGSAGNTIAYSDTNGTTWVGLGLGTFSTAGFSVAWSGTTWVATGQGTNSLAYSYDGITWIGVTNSLSLATIMRGVNFNSRRPYQINFPTGITAPYNGVVTTTNPIVLAKYGNLNTNTLDVVAEGYYNRGFSNMTVSVKSVNNL